MAYRIKAYEMLLLSVVVIAILYHQPEPGLQDGDSFYPELSPPPSSPNTGSIQRRLSKMESTLKLDYYEHTCSDVLPIVNLEVARIVSENVNATAQLLRLMFHDCFIQGCDGSILLSNSTGNRTAERYAKPSETLNGFNFVDQIKDKLEKVCPGIVSCSDILVLATRDALNLSGGPFFTVLMGRKDSMDSYFDLAMAEIPKPNADITEILSLFSQRDFNHRETVALLGAHNIGKMDCQFILPRFSNFNGTGQADPTLSEDFLAELVPKCKDPNSSIPSGSEFSPKYYQNLVQGRGLLFADQQLMAHNETSEVVRAYAADSSGMMFRNDFMKALHKMANFLVPTGSQGEVRLICSRMNSKTNVISNNENNSTRKSDAASKLNINMWKSVVFILGVWVSRTIQAST